MKISTKKVRRPKKATATHKIDMQLRATGPKSNGMSTELRKMLNMIMKNDNLSAAQKNRRTKQVLNTMRDITSQKARTIRALGVAATENLTPTAASVAGAKITTSAINNANKLISGGANLTKNNTTDKREDEDSTSYGDKR